MIQAKRVIALAVSAALVAGANSTFAAGFQLLEQNVSGLGNAYAGQAASAQDASTVFFNPAGMTQLPGRNVVGGLNAIRPSAKFSNTGSTNAPFQPTLGDNGGDAGDWAFVPNAYLTWQLSRQLFVGIGVNAPFGLKTEYNATWVGRFHAIESELKTININPSVAWKVNEMFSVGAGVNYQRADATLSNAVNYSGLAALSGGGPALAAVGGPGVQGVAKVEGDDSAWGYNLGATMNVAPNTRIGAAYRSSLKYTLEGDVTFTNRPAALAANPLVANGPVRASIKLPSVVEVSLFHKLNPQWDLLADVSWTDWSTIKTLDIYRSNTGAQLATTPENWKDTWRVALGANYHYNDQWTFRFGTAYDQSPVPDADRTPRIPDQDRIWLSIGAQYRVSKQLAFDVGYTHIFVKDASSALCTNAAAPGCTGKNSLVGNYENKVDIIGVQARYAF